MAGRISFEEAINETLLFAKGWKTLSVPQQAVMKIIYGLPLNEQELVYWSAFSGAGIYDDLGYLQGLTHTIPYIPQEYSDITLIFGRRSGKSSKITSLVNAYEAICGGHKDRVGEKEDPIFLQVAQNLDTARSNLRQFILTWLTSSPVGNAELKYFGKSGITADVIRLKNGLIMVGPPSIKLRGQAIACCAMDELCVWPKDREASNPDIEVQRAVEPALMSFFPYDKLIKVSTPMTEEGLLWQASQIGTKGVFLSDPLERLARSRTLVLQAPTAALEATNDPKRSRAYLSEQRAKDAEAFPREYLAKFAKSVSGFLSPDLLRACVAQGVGVRPPEPGQLYVATLDPAFRRDAFALIIGHISQGSFVQDYVHAWRGAKDEPLRPGAVLDEVVGITKTYGINVVATDQYSNEALTEMAQTRGMILDYSPLTLSLKQQMWTEFNYLLNQHKMSLIDHPQMIDELLKMERIITKLGNHQYMGAGTRDDLAMATALCVHKALQWGETRREAPPKVVPVTSQIKTRIMQRVRQHVEGREEGSQWWAH